MNTLASLSRKEKKDLKILAWFTAVYCRDQHAGPRRGLSELPAELGSLQRYLCCSACRDFLAYAIERRRKCPLAEKPACKHCHIHCFRSGHREQVRKIMRYSGQTLIKRGRLDLLWHYLF